MDCAPNDPTKWRSDELYIDKDGDGYDNGKVTVCFGDDIPAEYIQTSKGKDCDDDDANINPGTVWYKDADNDGYSDGTTKTQCTQPAGYKLVSQLTATTGDCDDNNPSVHPGAPEICGNGIDEDCNGKDDVCTIADSDGDGIPDDLDCAPNDPTKWRSDELYIDKDGDGYDNGKVTVCFGDDIPAEYIQTSKGKDCDDNDANINPETVWYKDADNDGYSDGTTKTQCAQPAGYKLASQLTAITGDCDDNDATIHPGAEEICGDGKDNDCDGQIDGGVPTDGLIAYYPLDGNAKEILGTTPGIDGTLHGVTPIANRKGTAGKALHFEDNQYVAIPDHDLFDLNNGDYSISLWVKYENAPDDFGYSMILCKGGYTTPGYQWFFNYPNHNEIQYRTPDNSRNVTVPYAAFNANQWHHYVFQRNGGTLRIYTDGELLAEQDVNAQGSLANNYPLYLGGNQDDPTNQSVKGDMDELRFYTRALTPTEVKMLYADGSCQLEENNTFYSKSTGDLHNPATWGSNPDGSGAAPSDFGEGKTFTLANRSGTYTLTDNWTVGGTLHNPTGSRLQVHGHTLSVDGLTGDGTLTGSATSSLVITGTGDFGTLNFSPGAGGSLKALTINHNGTVTIGTALSIYDMLTVNSGTLNTANRLTLKSNADNTARVTPVAGNITGNVTVERYIPSRRAWRIMSAPVTGNQSINDAWQEGVTLSSSNPNPYPGYGTIITKGTVADGFDQNISGQAYSILSYDNATNTWKNVTSTRVNAVNKIPYFLFVRGDRSVTITGSSATTLRATGPLKLGDQTIPTFANGFTAVANPFASPVNFATITRNNVDNSFYVWDPKMGGTNGVGAYVNISFNGTGYDIVPKSVSPESQYIQSGQGFLVHSSGGAGSVVIKESDKSATPARNVFRVTEEKQENGAPLFVPARNAYGVRVSLQSADATGYAVLDETMISYSQRFEDKIDGMDVKKLYNVMENISLSRNGQVLMVERRSPITSADTIRLRLDNTKAKDYMLEFDPEALKDVVSATLVDHYLHSTTTISTSEITRVQFTVNEDAASSGGDRFELRLTNRFVQPAVPSVRVYPNPFTEGYANLLFDQLPEGKYRLELVNNLGQIIVRKEIWHTGGSATHRVKFGVSMTAGIYYLKITGEQINTHIKLMKK